MKSDLVHQVARVLQNNKRRIIAHTKDRGEVRGSNKKPWRQKGTGRARVGSRRSPIWRGGGVTFGPSKERNFKRKITYVLSRMAVNIILEAKEKDKEITTVESIDITVAKTKLFDKWLKEMKIKGSSLIVTDSFEKDILVRAGRNIPNTLVLNSKNVNALSLLEYKNLIITKEALKNLKSRIKPKTKNQKLKVQTKNEKTEK